MKSLLFLRLIGVVASGPLFGQSVIKKHSLSIDAKVVSSGGTTKSRNALKIREGEQRPGYVQTKDRNFSSVRKKGSGIGLEIEVRNLGSHADQAKVKWFFLAKKVDEKTGGDDPYVVDQGSESVSVSSADRTIVAVESPELESKVEKKLTLRSGYRAPQHNLPSASVKKSGSKIAGWIVLLIADGQVLQVRASSPSFETLGRNQSALDALPRKIAKDN